VKQSGTEAYFANLDKADLPLRQGHHEQNNDGLALDGGHVVSVVGFDYDAVDRELGLTEPEAPRDKAFVQAADLLEALILWLSESATVHACGLRALALSWALRPRAFEHGSVSDMAKHFGVTKQAIGKYMTQVYHLSRGIFTTGTMRPPDARERQSKISNAYHRSAGHAVGEDERREKRRVRHR